MSIERNDQSAQRGIARRGDSRGACEVHARQSRLPFGGDFRPVIKSALFFLVLKACILGCCWFSLKVWGELDQDAFGSVMMRWPRDGQPIFGSHFATWDGAHYLFLSEVGYKAGSPSCAFYPAWPMLVRFCANIAGGSHLGWSLLLSNLISALGFAIFKAWVQDWAEVELRGQGICPKTLSAWTMGLMLAFPGAIFFEFPYSESLFLILVVCCLEGIWRRTWWLVAMACFLMPLTRAVGVFVSVPLLATFLGDRIPTVGKWCSGRDFRTMPDPPSPLGLSGGKMPCWLLTVPAAGWLTYFLVMRGLAGNAFEGITAQGHWHTNSAMHLLEPFEFAKSLIAPKHWHAYRHSAVDRVCFCVMAVSAVWTWRLNRTWVWWIAAFGLAPAMIATFTSFMRYMDLVWPVYLSLAWGHLKIGDRRPLWIVAATFAVMRMIMTWRHLNFEWAG